MRVPCCSKQYLRPLLSVNTDLVAYTLIEEAAFRMLIGIKMKPDSYHSTEIVVRNTPALQIELAEQLCWDIDEDDEYCHGKERRCTTHLVRCLATIILTQTRMILSARYTRAVA